MLKISEHLGFMVKALIADETQRSVGLVRRLHAGKPQGDLMLAAQKVIEARG